MEKKEKLYYYERLYDQSNTGGKIAIMLGMFQFKKETKDTVHFKLRLWNPLTWIFLIIISLIAFVLEIGQTVINIISTIKGEVINSDDIYIWKDYNSKN